MGFLGIERRLFYVMAIPTTRGDIQRQVHLRLRDAALTWPGQTARTIRYLGPTQLGPGNPRKGITGMREYLLGKHEKHGKLIVAAITSPEQIMTKPEIFDHLLARYNASYPSEAFTNTHRIHKPNVRQDEAWFLFDPSQMGQKTLRRDSVLRLSRDLFRRGRNTRKLYLGKVGRSNVYDEEKYVPLGVAYRLVYYGGANRLPPDLPIDYNLERRVNQYLAITSPRAVGTVGKEQWYAMASSEVPYQSQRDVMANPPKTWTHGVGFQAVPKNKFTAKRPFMMVVARDSGEAKDEVVKRLRDMSRTDYKRAATLAQRWLDTDRMVIPRRIIDRYRK
jgi:hypothetical protein